jgi:hypothetical protein
MEPLAKRPFRPNSALCSKFYPRNIKYMPALKFFSGLDFGRKPSFCKRLNGELLGECSLLQKEILTLACVQPS